MKTIIAIAAALLGMTTITASASAQWSTSGRPRVVVVPAENRFRAQEPWRDDLAVRTERLATDAAAFTSFSTNVISYPHTNREGAEFVSHVQAFNRAVRSGASASELMRTFPQLASESREFSRTMTGFLATADMNPTIAEVYRLARRLNESMVDTQNYLAASERAEREYLASYRPYYPEPRYVYAAPRVRRIPARGHRGQHYSVRFGF